MTMTYIFKRMCQQWRTLLVLVVVFCLVTDFFVLAPLYLLYTNEALLRYTLDKTSNAQKAIQISLNDPNGITPFIAKKVTTTLDLADPFSLISPILILIGSAMVRLRIFPRLMHLLSLGVNRLRRLVTPLATWLYLPMGQLVSIVVVLVIGFVGLLGGVVLWLRQISLNQVLRLEEE